MWRGNLSLAALLWLVVAFLVIYPLSILLLESFKIAATGGWGIGNYLGFFQETYYLKTFGNTLMLSTLVLLVTTLFGVPLAYILARYRQYGKTVLTALILLPIVLPAYAGVFAFIIFLGKYGTVNLLLMDLGVIRQPINFIYGFHGLVFIQSLHMLPFIVLSLSAGFTNIDPAFEEAAEVEGATGFRRFLTVTLPLCTPSYLAGAVLVFLWPFTDWLTPMILGQVDFLPSVAYINISYHFTDVHHGHCGGSRVILGLHLPVFAGPPMGGAQEVHGPFQRDDVRRPGNRTGAGAEIGGLLVHGFHCRPRPADSRCSGLGRFFKEMGF
jgi:ABC-type Fe3+ transport system permease subunit